MNSPLISRSSFRLFRLLSVAGWGLAAILGLSGCSNSKPASLVLRYSAWGSPEASKIFASATDAFRKAHPGVEIKMEQIPYGNYVTKLLTQFAAGTAPDVMLVSWDQLGAFGSRGVLADLSPYVSKDASFQVGDFFPEAIGPCTFHGGLIALPTNIDPIDVIYYNKKAFDEEHLPYPKDDWTLDEFLQTAQRLTKKDEKGNTRQYGFLDEWVMWDGWVFNFGGSLVDDPAHPTRCVVDSPAAVAALQFRTDLTLKWGVTPGPEAMKAMGGNIGNDDFFVNGRAAMFQSAIWEVPLFRQALRFDWDVVELPKGPGGHRGCVMNAAGYGIVKGCKHPDLAYELVKILAGRMGQEYLAASGLAMPALKPLAQSKVFLDGLKPLHKGFLIDAVKDGRFISFDPRMTEWSDLINVHMDRVMMGTETPEFALKQAAKEVNRRFFSKP